MPSDVGNATFGVRIETGGDPGLVAAMIAPLAGADAAELETQLIAGPVVIAEGLTHDDAMELLHACTRMGAEARLVSALQAQARTTDSGTLIGASVAGLIEEAQANGAEFGVPAEELARLLQASGNAQTEAFTNEELQAALNQVAERPTAVDGHKTLALGSLNIEPPGAAVAPRASEPGRNVVALDPFALDPNADNRKATVPLLPAVDRPPPLVAPPNIEPNHEPLETSGMGSVGSGPLLFRLDPPEVRPTATGSLPRPARLTTSSPVAAVPPVNTDTLADQSLDEMARAEKGGKPRRFDLMEAAPVARRGRPRMPTLNAQPTSARRSEAAHRPGVAALLSLVLPGMGQVYNGRFERGGWYALGALLVVPWVFSIADAWRTAKSIRQGLRRVPPPGVRWRASASQLALNVAVLFVVGGGVVLYRMRAETVVSEPPPATVRSAAPSAAPSAPPSAPPSVAKKRPIEVDLPVEALMRKGQAAFDRGLYAEAEDIMHAIIRRDPDNQAAYRLLVEANSRRQPRKATP